MKYKLYDNATNNIYERDKVGTFLKNRGIENPNRYRNLNENDTYDYGLLDNMYDAVELFDKHFVNRDKIAILVDEDADGFCSAAIMYLYIKCMDADYQIDYVMHTKAKAHGLHSNDFELADDVKLFIIPDAGTNDYKECKKISEKEIDILILDHHEKEDKDNPYALIVNNQISDRYPNKELCGAGIVYKFCQALDGEYWNDFADDYLDLVALANISDVMDMRSFETRYYVNQGLLNIKNKAFSAIVDAQEFSTKGIINPHTISYYITPVINGCIRFGSQDEKELLFRAFIEQDEYFEYKKKATKDKPAEIIQESIYDRAARLSKNAKSRQDKARDKAVKEIIAKVGELSEDEKIVLVDVTDITDSSLTGVVAIKISEYYCRPCILVNGTGGSARNFDHSPINSIKDVINNTGIFNGQGHANACGILGLKNEEQDNARTTLNEILKDVVYDPIYLCDYIIQSDDVNVGLITDLSKTDNMIGHGIDEPMIAVENIELNKYDISIFGKNTDTISFIVNDVKFIMFRCDEKNDLYNFVQDAWSDDDNITITIVGQPSINDYDCTRTPQIIIEDVNVLENNIVESDEEVAW